MNKPTIAFASFFLVFATQAMAQSVTGKVTGAVSGAGSVAGQVTTGVAGSQAYNGLDLSTGSTAGGEIPGGLGVKVGDKEIKLRGAAGVGDNRGSVKAGVGIPF
jgi:hypothetical protein